MYDEKLFDELTGVAVRGNEDASVCITKHDEFHCVETHMDDDEDDINVS